MNLGLSGRTAIVCASSRGLGKGCALSLAREGVAVVVNGRDEASLQAAAAEIRAATGALVTAVAGDVTDPDCQRRLLAACPEPDILVNNAGGPPPGDFRDWRREDWLAGVLHNMIAPIELIRSTVDGMAERRFGRIVNITSVAVKMPFDGLWMSSAARSGLTGFVAGLARSVMRHNVTINNLLPGLTDTERLRVGLKARAEAEGRPVEEVVNDRVQELPAGRYGTVHEFGETCAFLCSVQAGYITGQNLLVDGGHYPGTF